MDSKDNSGIIVHILGVFKWNHLLADAAELFLSSISPTVWGRRASLDEDFDLKRADTCKAYKIIKLESGYRLPSINQIPNKGIPLERQQWFQ